MDDLVHQLSTVGLSKNESLAWLALLQAEVGAGLTGYEVASRSGVPRSAVYNCLRKLEERGAVFATGDNPTQFAAVDPHDWLRTQAAEVRARYNRLDATLASLPRRQRPEPVWTISAYDDVLKEAHKLIRRAERSVWLSAWPRELDALRPALGEVAHLHGVIHCPVEYDEVPGYELWSDPDAHTDVKQRWAHKLVLVVDRREALIGGTEPAADNQAVRTRNRSLMDLAVNQLVLDLTLLAQRRGLSAAETAGRLMEPWVL